MRNLVIVPVIAALSFPAAAQQIYDIVRTFPICMYFIFDRYFTRSIPPLGIGLRSSPTATSAQTLSTSSTQDLPRLLISS